MSSKKHVLMFLCLQKNHVLMFSCLSKKTCSSVLMSFKKNMFFCPPTALNFYQVAHNRIAHKQSLSCQSQVIVAQLYSAVA